MEDSRSKSCRDGRMQMEAYYGGGKPAASYGGAQDLRCYSLSYAQQQPPPPPPPPLPQAQDGSNDAKFKKGTVSRSWSFGDPELMRKSRIVSYKAYTVEGKLKGSLRKSFRWLRDKCAHLVHGTR